MAIMRHFNRHCSRISQFFLSGNISSRWIFPFFMDVKKRWSKKEKSLKSDPAPENTKQNTKILVNDLFFLYSFSYEIFVTWKFELFAQCFFYSCLFVFHAYALQCKHMSTDKCEPARVGDIFRSSFASVLYFVIYPATRVVAKFKAWK